MLSGLIAHTKARYMNHILHRQIYSGLFEILKDKDFYYHSAVGRDYSHLTEPGREAVATWINLMAWEMLELERKELDARAKRITWEELKK